MDDANMKFLLQAASKASIGQSNTNKDCHVCKEKTSEDCNDIKTFIDMISKPKIIAQMHAMITDNSVTFDSFE